MKKLTFLMIILTSIIGGLFAGGGGDNRTAQGQGPSGKLVIYTSLSRDFANEIQAELKKRFPGLETDFFCSPDASIRGRIEAQEASRKLDCDIILSGDPSYAMELRGKRIIQSYKSGEASSLAVPHDRDNYWFPVWLSNMVLAYNPARHTRRDIPEAFYDLAHSEIAKGELAMENPLVSGSSFAAMAALRDIYGNEYFEALGKNEIKLESETDLLAKLESGEYKVVMVREEAVLKKREQELSKLMPIYPDDGIIVIPTVIMTVSERWSANKNIRAAGIITDWFLSADAQNYFVGNWTHPARARFPKLPYDSITTSQILERAIPLNWENNFKQRSEIRNRFEQLVIKR